MIILILRDTVSDGVNLYSNEKTLIEQLGTDYINDELWRRSLYYDKVIIGDSYYDMINDKELLYEEDN